MGWRPAFGLASLPTLRAVVCVVLLTGFCGARIAGAADLNDLLIQKNLTPEGLARIFAGFEFDLSPRVQDPRTFLQRKKGDCADFSNLASTVLDHRGYTTKLVVVMMPLQTHVVCYVKEAGGFLDYNHRADSHPVIASDGTLEDIADKVANDFGCSWRMASFFRYRESLPVYLDSVFAPSPASGRRAKGRPAKDQTAPASEAKGTVPAVSPVAVQAVIN